VSLLGAIFGVTTVAQTLRMSVPYVCAGLGGVWSERSGVPNIALEGILLAGALGGVVANLATGDPWVGAAAGVLLGGAIGAVHALFVVRGGVDAIIMGLAINLVAAGGARFVLRALYESSSNSPPIGGFRTVASGGSGGLALLARTVLDPLSLATLALTLWTTWTIVHTRFGLRVRACGEDPAAAEAAGVNVAGVRVAAVSLGGGIAGLGGVALAYDQHQFQSGMSGGRGFIALAAVILSGWRPAGTAAACVAFAALDAAQIVVQQQQRSAADVAQALPYAATLLALWVISSRSARSKRTLSD
jgi:general nucleoside transport system permease protein